MLASITPLGERSRRQRWSITVSALIVGAASTGAAVGAVLAAAGGRLPLAPGRRIDLLVGLAAVALLVELRPFGLLLPTHRRQVDETWLHRYRGWVYGVGFGGQLGVGVWTLVTTPAVYVALVAEVLAPSVAGGIAIGAAFGLLRGATVLSTARVDSPTRLAAFHLRFHRAERAAGVGAVAAQAVVVVLAAAIRL
ncbi:MAG: hypothetical protein ACXVRZ_01690 [Gaiellaceae bacterium]